MADGAANGSNCSQQQGITMYAVAPAPAPASNQQQIQFVRVSPPPQGQIRIEPASPSVYPTAGSLAKAETYQVRCRVSRKSPLNRGLKRSVKLHIQP